MWNHFQCDINTYGEIFLSKGPFNNNPMRMYYDVMLLDIIRRILVWYHNLQSVPLSGVTQFTWVRLAPEGIGLTKCHPFREIPFYHTLPKIPKNCMENIIKLSLVLFFIWSTSFLFTSYTCSLSTDRNKGWSDTRVI